MSRTVRVKGVKLSTFPVLSVVSTLTKRVNPVRFAAYASVTIIDIKLKDFLRKGVYRSVNSNAIITKFIITVYILQPIRAANNIFIAALSSFLKARLRAAVLFVLSLYKAS
jgi:hypothetical protein